MKEGSKGKGIDDRMKRKRTHLRWKDGKGLRGIKTEHVLLEEENDGRERERVIYLVKRREGGREVRRADRERPYVFCLKKNVSCIRDKEKTGQGKERGRRTVLFKVKGD